MKKSLFSLPLIFAAVLMASCSSDDDSSPTPTPGVELSSDSTEYIFQHKSAKRGIGFNYISPTMALNVGNTISWAYNWAGTCESNIADAFDQSGV